MKDYYQSLEVERDADEKAIKTAYRKLANVWHPDKHQGEDEEKQKAAEEKFKKLAEAYSVLSDPEKKSNYDLTGDPKVSNSGFRTTGDMFDFFPTGRGFCQSISKTTARYMRSEYSVLTRSNPGRSTIWY